MVVELVQQVVLLDQMLQDKEVVVAVEAIVLMAVMVQMESYLQKN